MKGVIPYECGGEKKIIELLEENDLQYLRTLQSMNYIIFNYSIEQEEIVKKLSEKIQGLNLETKVERIKDPEIIDSEIDPEVEEWHLDF